MWIAYVISKGQFRRFAELAGAHGSHTPPPAKAKIWVVLVIPKCGFDRLPVRMRLAVRGVLKAALRTHSAEQAPLWGSLVTCVVNGLRVRH